MKLFKLSFFLSLHLLCFSIITTATTIKKNTPIPTQIPKKILPQKISLPFSLELSLDVIKLECEHYKEEIIKNGFLGHRTTIIIEEAELLVQTADEQYKNLLKEKIISLLKSYNLQVQFSIDNKIVPIMIPKAVTTDTDTTDSDDDLITKDINLKKKKSKIPKAPKHQVKKAKQIVASPKKIHGARRTMKRLKKEREEAQKRAYEKIKEQIATKERLIAQAREQNLLQKNTQAQNDFIKQQQTEKELLEHQLETMDLGQK